MDFILDNTLDWKITNGDFEIGDGTQDDIVIIARLNQGGLKSDPLLGPGLVRLLKQPINQDLIIRQLRLHLERDGMDWNRVKKSIEIQ